MYIYLLYFLKVDTCQNGFSKFTANFLIYLLICDEKNFKAQATFQTYYLYLILSQEISSFWRFILSLHCFYNCSYEDKALNSLLPWSVNSKLLITKRNIHSIIISLLPWKTINQNDDIQNFFYLNILLLCTLQSVFVFGQMNKVHQIISNHFLTIMLRKWY